MPEPADMIVPMLQRMQTDLSHIRGKVDSLDTRVGNLEQRFEAFGPYITYTMGLHSQDRADIERHDEEIGAIKRRLEALETQRA